MVLEGISSFDRYIGWW